LNEINKLDPDRNRGLEILLYKKEDKVNEYPIIYKFNFQKIVSLFMREINFKVEFTLTNKS